MDESEFLNKIIQRKNGLANMKVVFIDIVKFSKRKTKIQTEVIRKFTELTQAAITTISQEYIKYAQQNNLNFSTDLIKIPTGDGVLLSILFDGLEKPHLDFSIELLRLISEHNNSNPCNRFSENSWCNCHQNFYVRIGIDEGQGIVFTDLNGNYNVAGNVINMTSRVMDMADENTILMGETAYKNLIDMTSDVSIEDDFRHYKQKVKHGILLDLYQYCPKQYEFVNNKIPDSIQKLEQKAEIEKAFGDFTKNFDGSNGFFGPFDLQDSIEKMIRMNEFLNLIKEKSRENQVRDIDQLELLNMLRFFNPDYKKEIITIDKEHNDKEGSM